MDTSRKEEGRLWGLLMAGGMGAALVLAGMVAGVLRDARRTDPRRMLMIGITIGVLFLMALVFVSVNSHDVDRAISAGKAQCGW